MQTMQLFDQPEQLLWLDLTTEIVDKCPERYSLANDHRCSTTSCFNHAGYLPDNNRDVNIYMMTGYGWQKTQHIELGNHNHTNC